MCSSRTSLAIKLGFLLAALTACSVGCSRAGEVAPPHERARLRIGVLPSRSQEDLLASYRPLVDYLHEATGVELDLYLPSDYDDLLEAFHSGDVQLAWFGGLTFLKAEAYSNARPLVLRDVDLSFTSDFLVSAAARGSSLQDFEGKRFAFGPRSSTSGHLAPRHLLRTKGIDPETFFSEVRHSDGHDQTALWVQDGVVDIGAVGSLDVAQLLADGRLSPERVRVLGRTEPFHNYVWAVQADIDDGLRRRLLDAFLALDPTNERHARVLEPLGAGGYLPANSFDYAPLRAAAEALEMIGESRP